MTPEQARNDIERIRQFSDDLYYSKDEEGELRQLAKCELKFIDEHREINRRFDNYLIVAKELHGTAMPLVYTCVVEAALKQRATELQAALDEMLAAREAL